MADQRERADTVWSNLLGAAGTSQLHGDLMILILVRLPVMSILRFKSVCQVWYTLFMNPIFIKLHSRMMCVSTQMNNLSSLLVHTRSHRGNAHIFSLLLDPSCGNPVMKNLKPPIEGDWYHVKVLGCINGLVCLSLCRDSTVIVLWNPATRKQRQIPRPQLLLKDNDRALLGFAYDENSESYKIIRILDQYMAESNIRARVEIYSTRTSTWRTIEVSEFPWLMNTQRCGNAVAGVPYWLATDMELNLKEVFVWFDVSTEAFRVHPITNDGTDDEWTVDMGVMGEHPLAVYHEPMCCLSDAMTWKISRLDIRKLKKCEDGGKDSFCIEKVTIEPVAHISSIVGFRGNDEIIALDQHQALLVYDHHSTQTKYLPSYGNWGEPHVYDYTESLISPSGLA